MKKLVVVSVIIVALSLMALAVNAPRQPLLFYDIAPATGVSQEMSNILQLAVFNDLDPETNVPVIANRFNYSFYSNSPIYAVEMSVMAAKVLGIEKEVLENYPLVAPTFRDIQTQFQKNYKGNGYDFSRDFGYFDYVNSYMKKEIGYPLFGAKVKPLTELTRAQVIKAVVRLYAAKYNDVSLVKEAEELSKRFSANKNSGITTPPDVGYISVFERYFLTKNEKGSLVYTLTSPLFSKNMELQPDKLATRKWAIALVTEAYFSNNTVNAGTLVPQRSINNFITYTPYEKGDHEFFVAQLPKMKTGTVENIKTNGNSPSLFTIALNKGNEIIGLDNTIVVQKVEENERTLSEKEMLGKDFVGYYNSLAKEPSQTSHILLRGKIVKESGKYYFDVSSDYAKKYSIRKMEPLQNKTPNITMYIITGPLGSTKYIKKMVEESISDLKKDPLMVVNEKHETNWELVPKNVNARITASIPQSSKTTQKSFANATALYYPVIDRLNLKRCYATFKSIEKFNLLYEYENRYVSIDASTEKYSQCFIDYWKNIQKSLESLKTAEDAVIAGKVVLIRKKVQLGKISLGATVDVQIRMINAGKLLSLEPTKNRIITQRFSGIIPFSSGNNPTPLWLKLNGWKKHKYFSSLLDAYKLFFNQKGFLKNFEIWFQFQFDKSNNEWNINYIVANEE